MLRWLQLFQPRPPAFNRASHSRLRFSLSVINSTSSTDPLTREDNCVSQIAFFGPGCRGFGLIGVQSIDRQAGDSHPLASSGFSSILAMEKPPSGPT